MRELKVSLPGWIIEDASYPIFTVGQVRSLAFEVWPRKLKACENGAPCLVYDDFWATYNGVAQISLNGTTALIDFGSVAGYKKNIGSKKIEEGTYAGEYSFTVNPYPKKVLQDYLYSNYEITAIELDNTPFLCEEEEIWADKNRQSRVNVQSADLDKSQMTMIGGNLDDHYIAPQMLYLLHLTKR